MTAMEQQIKVGQVWSSKDGKRTVRITSYVSYWDDCRWVNAADSKRHGRIYGSYLRSRYTLTEDAS